MGNIFCWNIAGARKKSRRRVGGNKKVQNNRLSRDKERKRREYKRKVIGVQVYSGKSSKRE